MFVLQLLSLLKFNIEIPFSRCFCLYEVAIELLRNIRYKGIVFRLQKGFDLIVRISIKDREALSCWNNAYLYSRIYTYFVDFYCTRLDQVSGDDR